MHLAYIHYSTGTEAKFELALVPDKPLPFALPLPISYLEQNPTAFYMVGVGEGVNVSPGDKEGSFLILATHPAIIYLTPNTTDNPGLKATELRLTYAGNSPSGRKIYQTEYRKDNRDKWRPFVANQQRKGIDLGS